MTLLELAEKAGVKFHRCDAAWGGTWGWSIDESCKFNGSESQEAACESWARTTFGECAYKVIKSLLAENARLRGDAAIARRVRKASNNKCTARNNKLRTTATNQHKRWSEGDLLLLFDANLSDREIADRVNRSYQAVAHARMRYFHLAPEGWVAKSTPARPVQEVK